MKIRNLLLILLTLAIAVSCRPKARRLFVIGIDGASSKAVEKADMPYFNGFLKESSYSFRKRSVLPSSSAINWATMFMSATSETHGYTEWGSQTPEIPSFAKFDHDIFPTVFQLYRKANPYVEMGCITDWPTMKCLIDSLSFNTLAVADNVNYEPERLTQMAVDYIKSEHPYAGLFFFANPDGVGHHIGWETPEYFAMLSKLDGCIGRIIETIKEEGLYDESMIVILSDHGGIGRGHGGKTFDELEAPAVFNGPGIRKGYCLDADWCMHQYDVGATIAEEFALKLPDVCCGKPANPIFE